MSRLEFQELCDILRPFITPNPLSPNYRSLSAEKMLAVILYFLKDTWVLNHDCKHIWNSPKHHIKSNYGGARSYRYTFGAKISILPGMPCPLYCHYKYWWDGIGGGWLIYIGVWVRGQGGGYHLIVFFLVLLYLFPHVLNPFI